MREHWTQQMEWVAGAIKGARVPCLLGGGASSSCCPHQIRVPEAAGAEYSQGVRDLFYRLHSSSGAGIKYVVLRMGSMVGSLLRRWDT